MRTRGNKAMNDKDSILADTKNLLYILYPAIQRMPKIERIEGAPVMMKSACYGIIGHFSIAKECPEVRLDHIRAMFGEYGKLLAAFDLCIQFGFLTDGERLRIAIQLERMKEGVRMNERKFYDQPYWHGLEFLGSHIKPHRIHLNNDTYGRAVSRVEEFNRVADKYHSIDAFVSSFNSYTGLLKNRTDFKRMMWLRDSVCPYWWTMCGWDGRRQCVTCLPGYTLRDRLNRQYNLHIKRHGKSRDSGTAQRPGVKAA